MVRRFSFGLAAFCLILFAVAAPARAQSPGTITGTVLNGHTVTVNGVASGGGIP